MGHSAFEEQLTWFHGSRSIVLMSKRLVCCTSAAAETLAADEVPGRWSDCHSAATPHPSVGVSIVMERGCQ